MKVALFTPFSPDTGGGAVLLKSFVNELDGMKVDWYYLADTPATSFHGIWLGPSFSPTSLVSDLFSRIGVPLCSAAETKNLAEKMRADVYWVVAHNEGVCLASELQASGKRVHLTVHDDPIALFARSRKYWALQAVMSRVFRNVLRSAVSVDVISSGMRDRYRAVYGVDCFSQFRYLPTLPGVSFSPSAETLRIGHIGSLYHGESFRCFVEACKDYALKENRTLRIVRIGASPAIDQIASANPDLFENAGQLTEEQAIPLLATCDFVYAMYPAVGRFRLFRQTSFPAKLATYIQAKRPVFAHTPPDSTLADAVLVYEIGEVCSSNKSSEIERCIRKILVSSVDPTAFERFRADLLGFSQLQRLKLALNAAT